MDCPFKLNFWGACDDEQETRNILNTVVVGTNCKLLRIKKIKDCVNIKSRRLTVLYKKINRL